MPYRVRAHFTESTKPQEFYVGNRIQAFKMRRQKLAEGAYYGVVVDLLTGEEFGVGLSPLETLSFSTETGEEYVLDQAKMEWRSSTDVGKLLTFPIVERGQPVTILIPPGEGGGNVGEVETAPVTRLHREYEHRKVLRSDPASGMHTYRPSPQLEKLSRSGLLPKDRGETPTPAQE